ncbi:DUF6270 domain-containing protein [Arthrobacter oryzae]|uniref:Uncharacterized protein n=1 Tax=Arthrobacter oryzae TaxID=409290 RepID=A0A3N0BWA0_9MICC|nr:DUF6270 domain-containing protein [Arthrobacter oryzae]RNL53908.1 hypothetical protein D7003_11565 [Arthrobacter oryzae]
MSSEIFMYGSYVTRDCLSSLGEFGFELSRYVARQSVISAMAGVSGRFENMNQISLDSPFQMRSLMGDLNGSLLSELSQVVSNSTYVLMDLIDERGGIWVDDLGRTATNSLELTKSGILNGWEAGRQLIRFGTDQHFALWASSVDKLVLELSSQGIGNRVSIIKTLWAEESIEGDIFPFNDSKLDPGHMNCLYRRYYAYIDDATPFHLLAVPNEQCLTTRRHQWGMAPYHYIPECYEHIAKVVYQRMEILDAEHSK